MGISMSTAPSLIDYIRNDVPFSNKDSVKSFGVGLEFFGALEYDIAKNYSIKLDYSYFIKSLSYNYSYYNYDYFYSIHQPYLTGSYVLRGSTYKFKFGAAIGYHAAQLKKDIGAGSDLVYYASGLGYRGEIVFTAQLSNRLGSYISGFINGSSLGTLKNNSSASLINSQTGQEVNLSGFGTGLRLGLSFYFD